MRSIKAFVERQPTLSYFLLTFGLSWGGLQIIREGRPAE
jgi:hypothetical protein